MKEKKLKEKNFMSPPVKRRNQNINNMYLSNNNNIINNQNNIVDIHENIYEPNINKDNYYFNKIRTMRYYNNINYNKNQRIEEQNRNINVYIDFLQKQNLSLKQNIKS